MKPGGILLMVGGIWVLFQVLGGNALGRLGITSASSSGDSGANTDPVPVPTTPWTQKGGSTDAHGNPL